MREIRIRRLTTGSIFKLIFFGSWVGSIPVFLFLGLLASTGLEFLTWNGQYIKGWGALVGGPLLGLFLATFFGLFVGCLTSLGHWILSKGSGLKLFCELEDVSSEVPIDA